MNRLRTLAWVLVAVGPGTTALAVEKPTLPKLDVAEANNGFAWDLYGRLREQKGNLFFSPLSISSALTMTYAGARGETAREMAGVLHLPVAGRPDAVEVHAAWADAIRLLTAGVGERRCQLVIANHLWGQEGYPIRPEFLDLLKKHYGAGLTALDFARDAAGARKVINAWVAKATHDRIENLVPSDFLSSGTLLVLTNAAWFKGQWRERFEKSQTRDGDFFITPHRKVLVPIMRRVIRCPSFDGDGFQALEMPYQDGAVSMVVLLPKNVDGLPVLEKTLSAERVSEWTRKLQPRSVRVEIPKFKVSASLRLSGRLFAMGMSSAFDEGADFRGTSDRRPLFLGGVVHQAVGNVDEDGTEAASATAIEYLPGEEPGPPPVFRADHPFVFLIRDRRSGAILFVGRLVDPTH